MSCEISLADMLPVMEEVLSSGGEFSFVPDGRSMRPMLKGKRDTVTIVKPQGRLKKYDLPLYRRANGAFVMHRVMKVQKDGYVMRGDAQYTYEPGVTDEQIIGVMTSFIRNGKKITADSLGYRLYCRVFCPCYPLKRFVLHFINKKG